MNTSITPALYQLENVQKRYGDRTVLDINRLDIRQGEILGLVGPSGAGKSTLLRLLGFLEKPSQGQITYAGRLCDNGWPDFKRRQKVTMVFQQPVLLRRSVRENIAYGLNIRGRENGQALVADIIDQLGLKDLAKAPARSLSGGEAQRVALARAMVLQPEILLLDEPTSNLDPYNIKLIEEIVQQKNLDMGLTVVIVTHNVFQARRMTGRVGLLLAGKLVEVTDTETFFNDPQREETAAFVRGDIIY